MREYEIRSKAINLLIGSQYHVWYPARTRFKKEIDVFGVFDLISFKGSFVRWIQLTTTPNHAARRKKVQAFLQRTGFGGRSEVWSYDVKKRRFKMEVINHLSSLFSSQNKN